jgi:DNA topoisomerase III
MPKILWVAEKKSLADAVVKVLPGTVEDSRTHLKIGDNYFVWLDGHAFEQAMPDFYLPNDIPTTASGRKVWRKCDLPIIPTQWVLMPKENKKPRLEKLAQLLVECDLVYNLGDAGEEGQLLVDEALIYFNNSKPVKRVLINDYNESKVRQAISNVRDNNEPLFKGWYMHGLARSHYDWLFGLNCTRAMTLRGRELGFDGLLPVGSVQTPLLYIVRERDRAIDDFKPVPFYTIAADFKHAQGTFKAFWKAKDDQKGIDESGRLLDASIAQAIASKLTGKTGTVTEATKEPKEVKPPVTFSMNELQIEGFSRFGYTGQQVLDAAQKLYDTYKVATYPRSDNRYLSEAQHVDAPKIFESLFSLRPDLAKFADKLDITKKSASFDDKKMVGQEHHGIVPTVPESGANVAAWSEIERNVFDIIARSYLAQFASNFKYLHSVIAVDIEGESFSVTGNTPTNEGWKLVFPESPEDQDSTDDIEREQSLPIVSTGDALLCVKCDTASRKTKPLPRFDDKLLLEAMMNIYKFVTHEAARKRLKDGDGIGTTATRAGIIQDLKDRELLIPLKAGSKKLTTSKTARTLVDALPMDVKDPAQAGIFKTNLDAISRGEKSYDAFMLETSNWVKALVRSADQLHMNLPTAENTVKCTKCSTGILRRKEGANGAYWFCSNWNKEPNRCDAKFQDAKGKPLTDVIKCPTCKSGELRRKQGTKGVFWYCTNWNAEPKKCESTFNDKAGKPDLAPKPNHVCPTCKTGSLRLIKGEKGNFWGCSRYKEGCKTTFQDAKGKPLLTARTRA